MEEGADDLNCETCRNRYLMKWIFNIRISLKLLIASKTYTLKNCVLSLISPLALTSLSCRELKMKRSVLKGRIASWLNWNNFE